MLVQSAVGQASTVATGHQMVEEYKSQMVTDLSQNGYAVCWCTALLGKILCLRGNAPAATLTLRRYACHDSTSKTVSVQSRVASLGPARMLKMVTRHAAMHRPRGTDCLSPSAYRNRARQIRLRLAAPSDCILTAVALIAAQPTPCRDAVATKICYTAHGVCPIQRDALGMALFTPWVCRTTLHLHICPCAGTDLSMPDVGWMPYFCGLSRLCYTHQATHCSTRIPELLSRRKSCR